MKRSSFCSKVEGWSLNKIELLHTNFQEFFQILRAPIFLKMAASEVALYFDCSVLVQPAIQNIFD